MINLVSCTIPNQLVEAAKKFLCVPPPPSGVLANSKIRVNSPNRCDYTAGKMSAKHLQGVDDVKISLQKFGWQDYLMFVLMLAICAVVGIYFGFIKKKPKKSDDATDYLVGGRTMKVFPIAMSLIATFISGISLLGTPTEIYVYGIQYMYVVGGVITMGFVMMYVYLPVFHDLKLTSTYEVRMVDPLSCLCRVQIEWWLTSI